MSSVVEPTVSTLEAIMDAFNEGDVDTIMSFFSEDCVFDLPTGSEPYGTRYAGHEEVRRAVSARFNIIRDAHWGDATHWMCGEHAVSVWTLIGTTRAGVPVELRGCDLWHFADGKVNYKDTYWKIPEGGEEGIPRP